MPARTGCGRSAELAEASNRLANALVGIGVVRGDRVGLLVPQSFATAAAHFAIQKAGAVALPLSELFGPDALRHRLADSDARVLIVAAGLAENVAALAAELGLTVVVDGDAARRIADSAICSTTARRRRPASETPPRSRRS